MNIHAFYHQTVNGFDYGVQLHTLLGVIQSPQYTLCIMLIKLQKFENSSDSKTKAFGFIDPANYIKVLLKPT